MALIRWEPVAELNTIQNEMNRLFNTIFDLPDRPRRNGTQTDAGYRSMDLRRDRGRVRPACRSPRPLRRGRQRPTRGQRAHHLRRAQGRARATGGLLPARARVRRVLPVADAAPRRRPRQRPGPLRPRRARDPRPQARAEEAQDRPDHPRHQPRRQDDRERRPPGQQPRPAPPWPNAGAITDTSSNPGVANRGHR